MNGAGLVSFFHEGNGFHEFSHNLFVVSFDRSEMRTFLREGAGPSSSQFSLFAPRRVEEAGGTAVQKDKNVHR